MTEIRELLRKDMERAMEPDADAASILTRWIGVEVPMEPCAQFDEGVEVLREILPSGDLVFDRHVVLRKFPAAVTVQFQKDWDRV